jgi:predicted alpha/beta superfamily hydrolase
VLIVYNSFSQYKLGIIVKNIPASHSGEKLFIAGNFNGWDPAKTPFEFNSSKNYWQVELKDLKADVYEFKFTRGSWDKVQAMVSGADVQNNLVKLSADTTIEYNVEAWKDDVATTTTIKQHTAGAHVKIIDTAFKIPQLNTTRRIWIYLPEGYDASSKKYPVLYMHDGQNLFDEFTSGFGEWGVDECLDSLIAKGKPAAIVVGIDNGPERINEYDPYDSEKYGKGKGDLYLSFIVKTLKPFIDQHYRTMPERNNTAIAGSSLGGLISYYAMLKYPKTFGKAGVFSPAFWIAPSLNAFADTAMTGLSGKIFFYAGGQESDDMVPDMKKIMDITGTNSKMNIYATTDPEGRHNEQAWRKWFAQFYLWMMAEGNNFVVETK